MFRPDPVSTIVVVILAAAFFTTLVMSVLKLAGVLTLSWWWTLSPLLAVLALIFAAIAVLFLLDLALSRQHRLDEGP